MEDILHQYTMGNRAVCHECSSPSGEGTQLRKCGGCSIAIYCSKECQREAWTRRHRNECSSKDTQSQLMTMSVDPTHDLPLAPLRFPIRTDFPSPIAVRADFGQFRQHHAWALSTLIDAFVRLGWDHPTCSGQFDRGRVAVELYFAPVKDRGLQSTPANLWLLRFMALSSIEQRLQQNREFVRRKTVLALVECC
ncbi:hypothetical protein L226DRAFT_371797 [Lentinus tigrinus ALCF2SS1-7]|uniref:MYND-type domain-containing protein n=1 Tax=Lentinus tigrinus ALCF2SS1-6 TaxID=1328759 RepID=A0A5C2SLQ5_9APHY|nr:hypothetical protein L227DRAFT_317030 [Lentinus tigrinus ALCF2SS1-6]RPD76271.1 hypothetical protein L226DRAFT_371797 [Lentinus tigrinus ALCF2SS1-7]